MIGGWEPTGIQGIASLQSRHLAVLPVPGLLGDLHQDMGRGAIGLEISGSLHGEEAQDSFLQELRERFDAGDPVDFVADIVRESTLEQVLISELELRESVQTPETLHYRIVLREYTEPPEPSLLGEPELGADLDADLELEADLGLDLLDLPAITADLPPMQELLSPVQTAGEELTRLLGESGSLLAPLQEILGGS